MTFFETIKIVDGQIQNIRYHNERFNKTRKLWFGIQTDEGIEERLSVPPEMASGLVKCRFVYGDQIEGIGFMPYTPRTVASLKLVEDNEIDYSSKFTDRNPINRLYDKRGNCDDILIVKNGLITDTSTANAVFWDRKKWITPALPLLAGTKRQKYIDDQMISVENISVNELRNFEYLCLINAMLDLGDVIVRIENIGY